MRRRGVGAAASLVLVLVGCGSGGAGDATPGMSGPVDVSTAVSAPPATTTSSSVTAPRAGWMIGLPDGWVGVDREELRALDETSLASLAGTMNVEPEFLQGFVELEPFEAYAADPSHPREMRVVFSPQQMLISKDEIEALIEPFNGFVDSSTSMGTPAGNLAVTFFKVGEGSQQSYGALFIGNGQDKVSTIVLYLFAESPGALQGLVQEVGPRLEPTA